MVAPQAQRDRTLREQPEMVLDSDSRWETFPYWAVMLALLVAWFGWLALFNDKYDVAWDRISAGIWLTIQITLYSFALSLALGLVLGLGRITAADPSSAWIVRALALTYRNVSRTYIEFIRGVPILPLIFFLALVIIPDVSEALGQANSVDYLWRGILALAIIYGAYLAEVFRGGVQSVPSGQMEAGRSLGLSRFGTLRYVVLPQAMRAIIPPLGNDFIAILKDSSLLSVLAVGEVTLRARQYSAGSFRFRESYIVLVFIYVTLVLSLSFLLSRVEARMTRDRQGER
jgi:His/Glu/Gln/Arg/opine family amino acid ABC transporter permease subunit